MWQCKKCGSKGDFKLLGNGLIQCPNCGAKHFVPIKSDPVLVKEG